MQFIGSKQARIGFLAAGVALSGALAGSAQASVVTPTASLPLIGVPYVSPPPGAGCFTIATACVNPGPFILTNPVMYSYSGGNQIITAGVTYDATLTPPMETNIIGSVDLDWHCGDDGDRPNLEYRDRILHRRYHRALSQRSTVVAGRSIAGRPDAHGRSRHRLRIHRRARRPSLPTARRSKSTVSSTCSST